MTVATDGSDGFQRFMNSAKKYNIEVKVIEYQIRRLRAQLESPIVITQDTKSSPAGSASASC